MSIYQGKEPCQGCGRTGKEKYRPDKNKLCYDCQRLFDGARAAEKAKTEPYVCFFLHRFSFCDKVSDFAFQVLEALHNEHVTEYERRDPFKQEWGSNGGWFKIPARLYEPLKQFFNDLDIWARELKKAQEQLPENARTAVHAERTLIYNEGVEYGRNLLLQLESGGLSMDDFAKQIPYHKY